jgi:hypothetical protein
MIRFSIKTDTFEVKRLRSPNTDIVDRLGRAYGGIIETMYKGSGRRISPPVPDSCGVDFTVHFKAVTPKEVADFRALFEWYETAYDFLTRSPKSDFKSYATICIDIIEKGKLIETYTLFECAPVCIDHKFENCQIALRAFHWEHQYFEPRRKKVLLEDDYDEYDGCVAQNDDDYDEEGRRNRIEGLREKIRQYEEEIEELEGWIPY